MGFEARKWLQGAAAGLAIGNATPATAESEHVPTNISSDFVTEQTESQNILATRLADQIILKFLSSKTADEWFSFMHEDLNQLTDPAARYVYFQKIWSTESIRFIVAQDIVEDMRAWRHLAGADTFVQSIQTFAITHQPELALHDELINSFQNQAERNVYIQSLLNASPVSAVEQLEKIEQLYVLTPLERESLATQVTQRFSADEFSALNLDPELIVDLLPLTKPAAVAHFIKPPKTPESSLEMNRLVQTISPYTIDLNEIPQSSPLCIQN